MKLEYFGVGVLIFLIVVAVVTIFLGYLYILGSFIFWSWEISKWFDDPFSWGIIFRIIIILIFSIIRESE
jgi:hypothetical protein